MTRPPACLVLNVRAVTVRDSRAAAEARRPEDGGPMPADCGAYGVRQHAPGRGACRSGVRVDVDELFAACGGRWLQLKNQSPL